MKNFLPFQLSEGLGLIPGKIKYPLHFSPENCKGKFKFGPPSGVRMVGSYLLGTLTKPDLAVDLELSLPVVCCGGGVSDICSDAVQNFRTVSKLRTF